MISWQHGYTKTTVWGHCKEPEPDEVYLGPTYFPTLQRCILITQCPTRIVNTTNSILFNFLAQNILVDVYICLSSLEYRDKFKHVIPRFKSMSNPFLFSINAKYWTPYHNFEAFLWYNIFKYYWEHILTAVRY